MLCTPLLVGCLGRCEDGCWSIAACRHSFLLGQKRAPCYPPNPQLHNWFVCMHAPLTCPPRLPTHTRCAAGSSIALNKLPPESVAKIYPRRANTLLYTAPPPAPNPPPLPSSPYVVRTCRARGRPRCGCLIAVLGREVLSNMVPCPPATISSSGVVKHPFTLPTTVLRSARRSRRRNRSPQRACAAHPRGEPLPVDWAAPRLGLPADCGLDSSQYIALASRSALVGLSFRPSTLTCGSSLPSHACSPPAPPPFPPPGPPAPPVDQYVKKMPVLWGPIVMG